MNPMQTRTSFAVLRALLLTAALIAAQGVRPVAEGTPVSRPDLVVDSLTYSPDHPSTRDEITFTAVVKNTGTATARASVLSFRVGGESHPPTFSVPSLGPGKWCKIQRREVLEIAQRYAVSAVADVNDDVAESNEKNNERTRSFTVLQAADLLILAPQSFETALQPLVEHKNNTGMLTTLLTLESIYDDPAYDHGRDPQEQVKLAIAAAEEAQGVEYVMLVGDVDQFPVRYTRVWDPDGWGNSFAPSDLYYADLYDALGDFDDWDSDGDDLFGEMRVDADDWGELNQDQVDLRPDVGIGRIPASDVGEVETMVDKIIAYEQGGASIAGGGIPDPLWSQRMMLVTGDFSDPIPTADAIAAMMGSLGFDAVKHYHTTDWVAYPNYSDRVDLLNGEIDDGLGFVAYFGHGAGGVAGTAGGDGGSWAGWYDYSCVPSLNNGGMLPVMLAAACYTAQFHYPHYPYQSTSGTEYNGVGEAPEPAAVQPSYYDLDTMAEHVMVKHDVGGIAYVGGYTGLQPHSFNVVQRFFEELVEEGGSAVLGDVWAGGVERYIDEDFADIDSYWGNWYASAIYHHIQKMMLFGDPSLRLRIGGRVYLPTVLSSD